MDGAPGGWIVVRVAAGRVAWSLEPDAAAVLAVTSGCAAVGVDIPLGLAVDGRRACDDACARRLGRARSSIFPAPPRAVLDTRDYAEACRIAQHVSGRKISLQTFHITPKIAEWDALERPGHVVEVHPELAFRLIAPDTAFAPKKTARGAGQRIAALTGWLDPRAALGDLPAGARLDDVLDALAAAWSAQRWAQGRAEVFGAERDDRGRPMMIVA